MAETHRREAVSNWLISRMGSLPSAVAAALRMSPRDRKVAEAILASELPVNLQQEYANRVFLLERFTGSKWGLATMFTISAEEVIEIVDETLLADEQFRSILDWTNDSNAPDAVVVLSDVQSRSTGFGYKWNDRLDDEPFSCSRVAIALGRNGRSVYVKSIYPVLD
jgi:hypothetical protein